MVPEAPQRPLMRLLVEEGLLAERPAAREVRLTLTVLVLLPSWPSMERLFGTRVLLEWEALAPPRKRNELLVPGGAGR